MKNLSKAYYKDYFQDVGFTVERRGNELKITADKEKIALKNKELLGNAEENKQYLQNAHDVFKGTNSLINQSFTLKTQYPGLVTGVGISHEAKIEGEFKLGIHLDYTTGLPVIYGSTVKGVLRSAFQEKDLLETLPVLVPKVQKELENIKTKMRGKTLSEWANIIFGDDNDRDNRSAYSRDTFFDALIDSTNKQGCILASDSITPHGNDPLKDPTPLTFLRIASGCPIKFRFRLVDSDTLTAKEKAILFKTILIAFGIGAKTNVGYGRLKEQ